MPDDTKKGDQIKLLEVYRDFTDTGVWEGAFTYPGAGSDLFQQGLITQESTISTAGRAALWLLGKGEDPLPASKSFESFTLPLPSR